VGSHRRVIRNNIQYIEKGLRKAARRFGDTILWLEYDPVHSNMGDTYNEGSIPDPFDTSLPHVGPGVIYRPAKPVPAVWVRYQPPTRPVSDEGEYPTSSCQARISARTMSGLGLINPQDPEQHFNDRFAYRGKVYRVGSYEPNGWLGGAYLMIDVAGAELMPDELMTDTTPEVEAQGSAPAWIPGQRLDWAPEFPDDWNDTDPAQG
jgi:hypothetical protein